MAHLNEEPQSTLSLMTRDSRWALSSVKFFRGLLLSRKVWEAIIAVNCPACLSAVAAVKFVRSHSEDRLHRWDDGKCREEHQSLTQKYLDRRAAETSGLHIRCKGGLEPDLCGCC